MSCNSFDEMLFISTLSIYRSHKKSATTNSVFISLFGCAGVFSPSTLVACAPTHSPSFTPSSFRPVHVRPNSSLCVHPTCGSHQNSVSAGEAKFRLEDACWGRSPSPGGVVPLMELWFGFSPTPPGRYFDFCGSSVWHVQHFVFIIVSIVSIVSISVWLLPLV
jgi:hypothetical protein